MPNIDIQFASTRSELPSASQLTQWCLAALAAQHQHSELSIRVVDEEEIQTLNRDYRQKDKTTNVLSFPSEIPPELKLDILGDIAICAGVVMQEANEQSKDVSAHWAHMVVHGTLHLQGYDHIDDGDAEQMESKETQIMLELGFPAPYSETQHD